MKRGRAKFPLNGVVHLNGRRRQRLLGKQMRIYRYRFMFERYVGANWKVATTKLLSSRGKTNDVINDTD